ncbi:OsmC family protein [Zestomonas thermotolerans]|jgi:organic hydroperoxide reductase OsmC/OhrA|uniref:OsmC family protein n=1 Tax=Zestomonas thermotolerans TaxID=157784 RepID=UPI00048103CC|nr:OsmC family protein [Pseudomonas thermotolerans]
MTNQDIATALRRLETVLARRPEMGMHPDVPALARWQGGTRVEVCHESGARLQTDLPVELGGSGEQVTPGWLLRAGLAACAVTRLAMSAAGAGIELAALEVEVASQSDLRGLLGLADGAGKPPSAGPQQLTLVLRLSAPGVPAERLRALAEDSQRLSPVSCALQEPVPIDLRIEVLGG